MDENETPSTPLPTITSFYDKETGQEYAIEDPVARKRAEENASVDYEIGDLFFSMNPTSPAARFGGEWEQLENVFLRAANDTETGGSDYITLTVGQIPDHTHPGYQGGSLLGGDGSDGAKINTNGSAYKYGWETGHRGGGQSFNNMPSYQNLYVWKRVA